MKTFLKAFLLFLFIFSAIKIYGIDNLENPDSIIQNAQNGDAYCQGVLGAIYRRGEGVEKDFEKSYKWLKLSAEKDDPIGLYNLAVLYESGTFVNKNTAKANELYARAYKPMCELADKGDPRAQVNLGYMLESGIGVDASLQEALKWYEKAADAGYPRAQFLVGYKYYYGWGYEKDYNEAVKWLKKAAEHNYPTAQYLLGNMYANGEGVIKNFDKAVEWHRKTEKFQNNKEVINTKSGNYVLNGIEYKGDYIIPNLLPPNFKLKITEGSCGETCLWSIVNSKEFKTSQIEINKDGGNPGRGLHSNELYKVLDKYNIQYADHMNRSYFRYGLTFLNPVNIFSSNSKGYRDYLYKEIIEKIKQGNPIILGIKIYPDKHFFWDSDHFILLVGYNEKTNELIYNDFENRKRINADKLLNKEDGYSLINRYHFLNYIEILSF